MTIWQKTLFVVGTVFVIFGVYLLLEPNLYFCHVQDKRIDKASLYCLINKTRHKNGLQVIKPNVQLEKAAELRAFDIVSYNYFSHQSIEGMSKGEVATKSGYNYKLIGEILARKFNNNKDIFNAWMKSASHSAVILNPYYRDIGITVLSSDKELGNDIVVVGLFGRL